MILGSGGSPGGGNGNPLQYSCLENPRDKGVWQAAVHGVTEESDMTEHASIYTYHSSAYSNFSMLQSLHHCMYDTKIVPGDLVNL